MQQNSFDPASVVRRYISDVYRCSRTFAAADFQRRCFDLLQQVVSFDSAVWLIGAGPNTVTKHYVHPCNCPSDDDICCNAVRCKESLLLDTQANQEFTACLYDRSSTNESGREVACMGFDVSCTRKHSLVTAGFFGQAELYTKISVYRSRRARPFSSKERNIKTELASHMVEAYENNLYCSMGMMVSSESTAIADRNGVIHQRTAVFDVMLQREWCQWGGPCLPEEVSALISEGESTYSGGHITIQIVQHQDLFILKTQEVSLAVKLTPREDMVTNYLTQGFTYKEIAIKLKISPSTVTNHVNRIYKKLQVRNKTELSAKLAGY
jgi:DNA-binding CsgD family transcriptional regulator